MKTRPNRRTSGFTLIELLVVISIIAVLAGGGFAAGNAAIQKAKRITALATCTALELAVNNFYTEYGTMPITDLGDADEEVNLNSSKGKTLLQVLLGSPAGDTLNPRRIKFLTVKQGKNDKDGLTYDSSNNPDKLYDPWGGPFFVMIAGYIDDFVAVQTKGESKTTTLNGRKIAAWSNGADSAPGGSGDKATDNVKTW